MCEADHEKLNPDCVVAAGSVPAGAAAPAGFAAPGAWKTNDCGTLKTKAGAAPGAPGACAGEPKCEDPCDAAAGGVENAKGADETPNGGGALPAAANDISALAAGCVEGDVKLNEPKPPAPCCGGGVENDGAAVDFAGVVECRAAPPPLTRLFLAAAGLAASGPSWNAPGGLNAGADTEAGTPAGIESNDARENCDDSESMEKAGCAGPAALTATAAASAAASCFLVASHCARSRLETSSMSCTVFLLLSSPPLYLSHAHTNTIPTDVRTTTNGASRGAEDSGGHHARVSDQLCSSVSGASPALCMAIAASCACLLLSAASRSSCSRLSSACTLATSLSL